LEVRVLPGSNWTATHNTCSLLAVRQNARFHTMRFPVALLICLTILCATGTARAGAQQNSAPLPTHALTNQDIVRMTKASFGDATIVKMIETHSSSFDLSVDALLRLKELGISQAVIQAMLSTDRKPAVATAAPITAVAVPVKPAEVSQFLEEVGVYQVLKGKLVAIEPEIVNWRTGGVIKNAVTLGLDKGHVNGTIAGPRSKTTVATTPFGMAGSAVFYIRCLEGNSASEYQLLRFWQKGDRREFRSVTGGVLHMSGGATNNVTEFHFEKIAPRTYKVELPTLALGEYGFLAPGAAASADMASRGKIYTFRIVE
jgi:hypothetical protein